MPNRTTGWTAIVQCDGLHSQQTPLATYSAKSSCPNLCALERCVVLRIFAETASLSAFTCLVRQYQGAPVPVRSIFLGLTSMLIFQKKPRNDGWFVTPRDMWHEAGLCVHVGMPPSRHAICHDNKIAGGATMAFVTTPTYTAEAIDPATLCT